MRGRFITFEGGEGAGKSTQAALLQEALEGRGIAAILTREPGGTPGAEAVRRLLLDAEGSDWGARAEALMFAAARADHVEKVIRPALEQGRWVICDRFLDSTRAYQAGEEGLRDIDILELHRIGSAGLLPDLTLLLEIPPDLAISRTSERDMGGSDRIGGRGAEYHRRVAARFASIAQAEPARILRLAGSDQPDVVHAAILKAIEPFLERLA